MSLAKFDWSQLSNFLFAACVLIFGLVHIDYRPTLAAALLYPLYIACGVVILYSLTIALAATTVWLGRNQSMYEFWYYITNFSRYPLEIYNGPLGTPLRLGFTFIVPVLIVVNVPAQFIGPAADRGRLAIGGIFTRGDGNEPGIRPMAFQPLDSELPQRE